MDFLKNKNPENTQKQNYQQDPFVQRAPDVQEIPQNEEEKQTDTNSLISWKTTQFENIMHSTSWYVSFFVLIGSLVAYGLFSENYLLSIIAILIALSFYLFEKRESQEFVFGITNEGVFAQDRIYEFSSLESFWIFYEPNGRKELSLKSTKRVVPYISVPLGSADPVKIREILTSFLPEEEQTESIVDSINQVV